MVPPASHDPVVWAMLAVGIMIVLLTTIFWKASERLEDRLGLPRIGNGPGWRIGGFVAGLIGVGVAIAALMFDR